MKHYLLILLALALSSSAFSQAKVIWTDLDGIKLDTINVYRHQQETALELDEYISNTANVAYYVGLKRVIVSYLEGGEDLLCYGISCQNGSPSDQILSTAASKQEANTMLNMSTLIHYVANEIPGTTTLKYYIYANTDSLSVFTNPPQDSLLVNWIVEPYERIFFNFVVNMAGISGFDPSTQSVFVQVFDNGIGLGSTKLKKSSSNDYMHSKSLEYDGNLSKYTYKYYYGTKNITTQEYDTIGEPTVRSTFAVTDQDVSFEDNFGISTALNQKAANTFTAYPNPFNETINIKNAENIMRIEVANILGQTIYSTSVVSTNMVISTSDYKPGMYFLKVTNHQNKVYTERLMKK